MGTGPVVTMTNVKLVFVAVVLFMCICVLCTYTYTYGGTNKPTTRILGPGSWVSSSLWNPKHSSENLTLRTSRIDFQPRLPPDLPPENFTLVTAVESNDFPHLLHLIDSLLKVNPALRLLVWNIGLRDCQVAYLQNKKMLLDIRKFPFWRYPIHLKADGKAWKPVVIKKTVDEFGHALWLNPDFAVKGSLIPYLNAVHQHGFVALNESLTCSTSFVGFSKDEVLAYNVLQVWEKCAINWSCIASAVQASGNLTKWCNWFLTEHVLPTNYTCESIDILEAESKRELEKEYPELATLCELTAGCVLTGDHNNPCYSAPQLRSNKVNYAKAHGYRLIFESESFAERKKGGICRAVWGKIDALLKYMKECRTLLYVDDDAIFTNFSITLDSFFEMPGTKSKDMIIVKPTTDGMLNTSAILLHNTESVQRLLKETFNFPRLHSYCHRWPYEQGALWNVVRRSKKWDNTVIVMNDDHSLQSLCGFKDGKCLWRPGDFIAHFAPPKCPQKEIEEFMKQHQDLAHV